MQQLPLQREGERRGLPVEIVDAGAIVHPRVDAVGKRVVVDGQQDVGAGIGSHARSVTKRDRRILRASHHDACAGIEQELTEP